MFSTTKKVYIVKKERETLADGVANGVRFSILIDNYFFKRG